MKRGITGFVHSSHGTLDVSSSLRENERGMGNNVTVMLCR